MKPGDTVMKTQGEHAPVRCTLVSIVLGTRVTAEIDIPGVGLYVTYLDYLKPLCEHETFEYEVDE